jgi:hypothetical protein
MFEQIKLLKNEQREEAPVYAHLFNDALLYSSKLLAGFFKYKVRRTF